MSWFLGLSFFRKALIVIAALVVGSFAWSGIKGLLIDEHVDGISEQFAPMHNALEKASEREKQYDLEETIRIIHAIEYARDHSNDFQEFLVFMAEQDYSMVASDVVESQKQLLPILQDLYFSQDRLEEHESSWQLVKDMGGVTHHLLGSGVDFLSGSFIDGSREMLASAKDGLGMLIARDDKSDEMKQLVRSVKGQYIDYLNSYSKVYYAHMKEWNKLCLMRDRAYLDIQQGRIRSAMQFVDKALAISPEDKESRVLKALCLLEITEPVLAPPLGDSIKPQLPENLRLANEILDKYLSEFPERSAPALLLKGIYHYKIGEPEKAFSSFDQSSIEYPRQAEYLTDMFNSYEQRSYLSKSQESSYILELYKSSMEGFGVFSPNFHKAIIHQANGSVELAQEEIKRHFFRRGNQVVSDYLISDVQFCTNYLNSSFNSMFREKAFVDIETEPAGILGSDNELKITLKNRSDKEIQNARLYMCIHFTDMYKDDYTVIKMSKTLDRIQPQSTRTEVMDINYSYDGKTKSVKEDIVSARGILVTDDFISWIDRDDFKVKQAQEAISHYASSDVDVSEGLEEILERVSLTESQVFELLMKKSVVAFEDGLIRDEITIELPRILSFLDPVFSINEIDTDEAVRPSDCHLSGPNIKMKFGVNEPKGGEFDLFLQSPYLTCKISITKTDGTYSVSDVVFI